jgi:hypothetical protein
MLQNLQNNLQRGYMKTQLIDNPQTGTGQLLNDLVAAYSSLDDAWALVQRLRSDLATCIAETGEVEEVQKYVSLKRKRGGKPGSPKLAKLLAAYEEEQSRVLSSNSDSIYEAQLAYQAAEEALFAASSSPAMRQLEAEMLLEQSALASSGQVASSIVLKRRKVREKLDAES